MLAALGVVSTLATALWLRRTLEREVTTLERRIAGLEHELATLRAESRGRGAPEAASVRSEQDLRVQIPAALVSAPPNPDPARGSATDGLSAVEQARAREQEGALHTEELDVRLEQEESDPAWAPGARASLQERTRRAFPDIQDLTVHCGRSLCSMDLTFGDAEQLGLAPSALARVAPWVSESFVELHEDEKRARYYVAREEHSLFDAEAL